MLLLIYQSNSELAANCGNKWYYVTINLSWRVMPGSHFIVSEDNRVKNFVGDLHEI